MDDPQEAGARRRGNPGRRAVRGRVVLPALLVAAAIALACLVAAPRQGGPDRAAGGGDGPEHSVRDRLRFDDYVRRFRRAQQLFGGGRDAEAEEEFRRLLAEEPDAAAVHHALASVLWMRGQGADALEGFRRAAALAPRDGAIRRDCGLRLLESGFAAEALPHLEAARSILAADVETLCAAGRALAAAGRPADAEAAWREAISADPDSVDARAALARHMVVSRPEESLALLEGVPPNWPDVVEARALAAERLGRWEPAAGHWRRAAEVAPPGPSGVATLRAAAEGLVRCGDAAGAAVVARRWAAADPADGRPSLRSSVCLATALAGCGDAAEALRALDAAAPASPKTPAAVVAHVAMLRAHVLVLMGRADDARAALGEVAALDAPFERAAAACALGTGTLADVEAAARGADGRANDVAWVEWLAARVAGDPARAAAALDRTLAAPGLPGGPPGGPPGEHPRLLLLGVR